MEYGTGIAEIIKGRCNCIMKGRNTLFGIVLIMIGLSLYLRNFHIAAPNSIILLLGLLLLYFYYSRKEQPFLIFGGIFTFIGALSVLKDISRYRFNISFELFLIIVGIVFLFLYYSKKTEGFIYPGSILPALGIYFLIMRFMDESYMWPSIFVLLGLAFYFIYFSALMGKNSWPLIPGTILIVLGTCLFTISFGIINWDIVKYLNINIREYQNYIWPAVLILIGVIMLYKSLFRRR